MPGNICCRWLIRHYSQGRRFFEYLSGGLMRSGRVLVSSSFEAVNTSPCNLFPIRVPSHPINTLGQVTRLSTTTKALSTKKRGSVPNSRSGTGKELPPFKHCAPAAGLAPPPTTAPSNPQSSTSARIVTQHGRGTTLWVRQPLCLIRAEDKSDRTCGGGVTVE